MKNVDCEFLQTPSILIICWILCFTNMLIGGGAVKRHIVSCFTVMLIAGDAVKRHIINFSHESFAISEPLLKRLIWEVFTLPEIQVLVLCLLKGYRFFTVSQLSFVQMSTKIAINSLNYRKVKKRIQIQRNYSNANRCCCRRSFSKNWNVSELW